MLIYKAVNWEYEEYGQNRFIKNRREPLHVDQVTRVKSFELLNK